MRRYEHGGDIFSNDVSLDFSVNLNPLGMPETVKRAIAGHINDYETYPDPFCRQLVSKIALHDGVGEDTVLCGNGAADLIYRLCLAIRPKNVLVCAPAFSEYENAAISSGASVIYHKLEEADGFALTDRILSDITPDTQMVFICNPNNPTGRLADAGLMRDVAQRCAECGVYLICDECFLPFTGGESLIPLIAANRRVVILRAFTKLYSMAGIRLGYMLSSDAELIDKTCRASQCWSVSAVAQIAGCAALDCTGWEEETRSLIAKEREYLTRELKKRGFRVFDSDANFVLFKGNTELYGRLLEKGILIRRCADFRGLDGGYFRIGVKTRERNAALIDAIARTQR